MPIESRRPRHTRPAELTPASRRRRRAPRAVTLPRAPEATSLEAYRQYCAALDRLPPLTRAEEQALARRARDGDDAARAELITRNTRFVMRVARRYQITGIPLEDLVAEGNVGLLRAADKFDPDQGVKFISYAVWWIRQAIQTAVAEQARPVRLPASRGLDLHRVLQQQRVLAELLGRAASEQELAVGTGLDPVLVRDLVGASTAPVRLDAPIGDGEGGVVGERLPMLADAANPEADVLDAERRTLVAEALATLPPREAVVVRLYYGIGTPDGEPATLEVISRHIGVSRERVRQIRDRALVRLSAGSLAQLHRSA